ncbi:SH3 domain-containing protein [Arenibaculum pallidiluteum]|uniref:SH3 domain-containing protein n=1 Tax=Arenibaculum pallidiluteum TaxID=2812559 RepID=UPI001A95C2FE|nr:SH3 domain-containing protein [Arenibaculum pallidiluteum]
MKKRLVLLSACALCTLMFSVPDPAAAAPGDSYRVSGEKVNLRSGPSEQSNIRSTVSQGDDLLELRSQGPWIGVRVLRTGEEGWVYSDLVRRTAASTLGGEAGPVADTGFRQISPGFDQLLAGIGSQLGYRFAGKVERAEGNLLRVTPTQEWLYNTGRDAKLMTVLAVHEMWKSYNNGRPVAVSLVDGRGSSLMSIRDEGNGPVLDLADALAMN